MFDIIDIIDKAISNFLANVFEQLISFFAITLSKILSTSLDVLQTPLVVNGVKYAQALAFSLLVLKAMNEGFQTYILYQNGDPDADPSGLLIRTAQAVVVIATLPWIVTQIFMFGTKVALDVASLGTGKAGISDWIYITNLVVASKGTVVALFCIIIVICIIVIAIQATIRGAELSLMTVVGPIMALNLTANNRSLWTSWFKQVVIICTAQALQVFMLEGALAMITSGIVSDSGLLMVFGWLWVTIKTPKFLQQLAYSTGFTSAVGGTSKQAGTMYLMRKMTTK